MGYRDAIAEYIENEAKPREKFGHQPRLYSLTKAIGEPYQYDDDIVYAAVWLHDLGVFAGHRPEDLEELRRWDNTKYAAEKAPELLERFGFPSGKIARVQEAIRTHQPAFKPQSMEGMIVRDADILEQLGAVGVMRTVCKVGRDTRFVDFTCAVGSLDRALAELPSQILLESAKGLAEPRIRALSDFLASVKSEAGALLF